ncbi:MAG: hypothetical protein EBZ36_04495 [Acidobacteria bacterium]|nr:hypothetical protein [Acidobacteriota bacterium]
MSSGRLGLSLFWWGEDLCSPTPGFEDRAVTDQQSVLVRVDQIRDARIRAGYLSIFRINVRETTVVGEVW